MYLIDKHGYPIQDVEGPIDGVPADLLVEAQIPDGLQRPRWNGGSWEETGSGSGPTLERRKLIARNLVTARVEYELSQACPSGPRQRVLARKLEEARAYTHSKGGADAPLLTAEAAETKKGLEALVGEVLARYDEACAVENSLELLGQRAKAAIDRARSIGGVDKALEAFSISMEEHKTPPPQDREPD